MNDLYRKPLIFGHHQRTEAEGHLKTAAENCMIHEKGIGHNVKVPNHPTDSSQMNDHFGCSVMEGICQSKEGKKQN